jgi:hypothetical protein
MSEPKDPRATMLRICRACSCDDDHACVDELGHPCAWALLDIATPTGVCTACADDLEWDYDVLAHVGRGRDGVPLVLQRLPDLIRATG